MENSELASWECPLCGHPIRVPPRLIASISGSHLKRCNEASIEDRAIFRRTKRWPERRSEYWNEQRYKWRKDNPEKCEISNYYSKIKRRYGISKERYKELLEAQRGVCAICLQPCKIRKRLAIDHDHVTGKVRGLLCQYCNVGLAQFKDDTLVLESAIAYLNRNSDNQSLAPTPKSGYKLDGNKEGVNIMGGSVYAEDAKEKLVASVVTESNQTAEVVNSVLSALDKLGYTFVPKPTDTLPAGGVATTSAS